MSINIYWILVGIIIGFGLILPQEGEARKVYIILMTGIHSFICGFRYMYLVGDLRKYAAGYYQYAENDASFFSEHVFNNGRNFGFEWLKIIFARATNGDFQIFLIFLALVTQLSLALLIYRYSRLPWLSFLVWNCMSFYINYDLCAIKQGLAMAVVMCALVCAIEHKLLPYLILILVAGCIHMPAIICFPIYWIIHQPFNQRMLVLYSFALVLIYYARDQIVRIMQDSYYADSEQMEELIASESMGGMFFVILFIVIAGILMIGAREAYGDSIVQLVILAAILQMFSVYDNVFTRLSGYYLQFSVLLFPMIFHGEDHEESIISFNERSRRLLLVVITLILLWWYWRTCLGQTISDEVDNYLNYRFMWEVQK